MLHIFYNGIIFRDKSGILVEGMCKNKIQKMLKNN